MKVAWKRLVLAVAATLAVGFFTGTLILSIGVGSEVTQLNTVMSPLVCPGDVIVPAWKYKGRPPLAHGPDLRTRWICVNEATGEAHVAGYRTIFTAGAVYALILSALGFVVMSRNPRFKRWVRTA
jgi:hypothetical protein